MTTNSRPLPDCSLSVSEMVARHPETSEVFDAYGIDTCRGGGVSVERAAREAAVDLARLRGDLDAAIRIAGA